MTSWRRISLAVSVLGLLAVFPTASAHAQFGDPNPLGTALREGLEAGVNFDFDRFNSVFDSPFDTVPVTSQQVFTDTASPTTGGRKYAALGDSVAAGAGILVRSSGREDVTCGRSGGAYPQMVAEDLGYNLHHLACSGATSGDLVTSQGVDGPNIRPQLDAAFNGGRPDLITITAGANDLRWVTFLRKCYARDCGTRFDTAFINTELRIIMEKYRFALDSINRRSNGQPPRVIITGYYDPLGNECTEFQPRVSTAETQWMRDTIEALNGTLQNVANEYNFVTYAPVDFTGRDICSDEDPWVQTLDEPAPFHPDVNGQRAIADSVISAINDHGI